MTAKTISEEIRRQIGLLYHNPKHIPEVLNELRAIASRLEADTELAEVESTARSLAENADENHGVVDVAAHVLRSWADAIARAQADEDSWLASLADQLNTWARELRVLESDGYTGPEVKDLADRVVFAALARAQAEPGDDAAKGGE